MSNKPSVEYGDLFDMLAKFGDGLKSIASIHPMVAFGIMQLICNTGHVLLVEEFPNDLWNKQFETRRDAISEAFNITGAKFGDMMSSEALKNITAPILAGIQALTPKK